MKKIFVYSYAKDYSEDILLAFIKEQRKNITKKYQKNRSIIVKNSIDDMFKSKNDSKEKL